MSNEGVAAVEKALALLDCFTPAHQTWTLAALAKHAAMHRTTIYRLMNSLERMNYVIRSESGDYSLGPRLLYLGNLYEASFQLANLVKPALLALSQETGESASYNVLENGERLCLFRVEPPVGLRETRLPGTSLPLDNTCGSLVIRHWTQDSTAALPRPLPWFTSRERDEYTAAFAVPIFGENNAFMAAMTLSGPVARMEAARAENRYDALLLATAASLSRKLGASTAFCDHLFKQAMSNT
ncbi:IclR family transcriptional regulator [Robbsia andropogonis]|uniref:IclR family transcriptional regulator n=1 Tax=Robbsia andropogonis TaxID=28092 RepID=A0A0F5JYS3_9BURK|nr:IclR family transcriptional regulator [Robbsia andropogonis]KKB62978.1 IclR family transcriptional regulator [Robbsia andropogonis]